jgi:hypothetical protein
VIRGWSDARLRRDPVAWAEELEERRLFENTLMDGLEDGPRWEDEEGECAGAQANASAQRGARQQGAGQNA